MWITASGHRSSFTYGFNVSMKVILDRGTDSVRWPNTQSAIESCVYITGQLVLIKPCLHRLVKDDINNCFYEGNVTAEKLLAEMEQVQDAKSCVAEAANAEMVAKLLTVEASLSEAHNKILVLQQQNITEAEARGCWTHS